MNEPAITKEIKESEMIEYLTAQNESLTSDVIRLANELSDARESKGRLLGSMRRIEKDLSNSIEAVQKVGSDIAIYRRAICRMIEIHSSPAAPEPEKQP